MDNALKIYTYIGGSSKPFPNADTQIEILNFNYDAKRMGGAPTITATIMYPTCLDKVWTGNEFVTYKGERYKLKQTPTSAKSNDDVRYKHELEFVALRAVLDFVYFYDATIGETSVDDKPVSNNTTVAFSGTIHEFARRLNNSLQYTGLQKADEYGNYTSGYRVIVDKGIDSETKFLSFVDQPISSVLQEIYKQYEIPYYFDGEDIHIGFTSNTIPKVFKYGEKNELLSVSKNNANNKVITRCTGTGSSENIPYYYPNTHPLGLVNALYNGEVLNNLTIPNNERFGKNVKLSTKLTYSKDEKSVVYPLMKYYDYSSFLNADGMAREYFVCQWWECPQYIKEANFESEYGERLSAAYGDYKAFNPQTQLFVLSKKYPSVAIRLAFDKDEINDDTLIKLPVNISAVIGENEEAKAYDAKWDIKYYYRRPALLGGATTVDGINGFTFSSFQYSLDDVYAVITLTNPPSKESVGVEIGIEAHIEPSIVSYSWKDETDHIRELEYYGLKYNGQPNVGDVITFVQVAGSLVPFQSTLMPPIYWRSKGRELFYNAFNDTYISPETGDFYVFENEYTDNNRREHKEDFEYIKPSIKNVKNNAGERIDSFIDFAYDNNDNDEIDSEGNYIHPYFFAKLRRFDGENGFNLFDHASEQGEMTISMTSGNCGACNFVIGVDENTMKNKVQVDDKGNLVRDENGNVVITGTPQTQQNDTQHNEVWIALRKDASTFPHIMPNATYNYKPNVGDTFLILNISLPTSYIREAEKRLEEEIIKFMALNNSEKFTFAIKFSRIYLAENKDILDMLDENARIQVEYNGETKTLYVSSFSYKVSNDALLPEITVDLDDTLVQGENAIQQALSALEHSIMSSVGSIDFYKQGLQYFIRKDVEDYARALIHFDKGAYFGANDIAKIDEQGNAELVSQIIHQFIRTPLFIDGFAGQGFKLWLDENGISNLTVDNITARQTVRLFEMLVTKLRAVNGGLFVSAANGTIKEVNESEDGIYYDIVLENENTFIKGDYMRCQVMSGTQLTQYWVEIANISENTVSVAKTEFGVSLPKAGQDVVLCGSKNVNRQNAIHISATEDGQPRISIYNGISTKSLAGCLRTQLGNLDNIDDDVLKPQGDGLYSDNAYLKGEFVLKNTGENVETKFEVTDGSIKSAVGTLQNDMEHGKTILYNPSFTKGEDGWITSNAVIYYLFGDTPVYNNGKVVFNNAHDDTDPDYSNHRFILNITDGYIRQLNEYFVNKPDIANVNLVPISLGLKMMVEESGLLLTYLDGCDLDATKATAFKGVVTNEYWAGSNIAVSIPTLETSLSFMNTKADIWVGNEIMIAYINNNYKLFNLTTRKEIGTSLFVSPLAETDTISISEPVVFICGEEFTESEDYLQLEYVSRWNGTGHFNLAFGGGASIYSLQLFTNPVEARYATLFEQTDKLLKLSAMNFNDDGTIKQESGIVVQADGAGLYARNYKGEQAKVAAYENGVVTLEGEHIQLKGNITANGNVSIDDEGKLHAKDGEFEGKITAKEGKIAEFEISENGLTYEAGAYTASFTKEAFVLGGEIEYIGLVARTKTFTVRGEDSVDEVSPLTIAERKLAVDEQNFANVPIVRIQDKSSFPTVALETTGAIYSNGSFIQRGALLKLTDAQSPNLITILKNTLWVISNNYQSNAFVYLPRLTRVRELLNINDDEFFAIPIEVLITHNSQYDSLIAVESESGESAYQYKIIDWNGGSDDYQRLSKGDSMRLLLIYDGETYYAQILRKTT